MTKGTDRNYHQAWREKNRDHDRERKRLWREQNAEKTALAARATFYASFGATLADFERLALEQGFRCDICRQPMTHGRGGACFDHDHATMEPRGLLCAPCNAGLGRFRDNPETLDAAAAYLRRHGKR